MVLNLFDSSVEIICTHNVSSGQTVSKKYLVEVSREFKKNTSLPKVTASVHKDNTSIYNYVMVTNDFTEAAIKTDLTYSSELVTCDFWLLPKLQVKIKAFMIMDLEPSFWKTSVGHSRSG